MARARAATAPVPPGCESGVVHSTSCQQPPKAEAGLACAAPRLSGPQSPGPHPVISRQPLQPARWWGNRQSSASTVRSDETAAAAAASDACSTKHAPSPQLVSATPRRFEDVYSITRKLYRAPGSLVRVAVSNGHEFVVKTQPPRRGKAATREVRGVAGRLCC